MTQVSGSAFSKQLESANCAESCKNFAQKHKVVLITASYVLVGAGSGAVIGGIVGSAFGPAGIVAGAVIGAAIGALVGLAVCLASSRSSMVSRQIVDETHAEPKQVQALADEPYEAPSIQNEVPKQVEVQADEHCDESLEEPIQSIEDRLTNVQLMDRFTCKWENLIMSDQNRFEGVQDLFKDPEQLAPVQIVAEAPAIQDLEVPSVQQNEKRFTFHDMFALDFALQEQQKARAELNKQPEEDQKSNSSARSINLDKLFLNSSDRVILLPGRKDEEAVDEEIDPDTYGLAQMNETSQPEFDIVSDDELPARDDMEQEADEIYATVKGCNDAIEIIRKERELDQTDYSGLSDLFDAERIEKEERAKKFIERLEREAKAEREQMLAAQLQKTQEQRPKVPVRKKIKDVFSGVVGFAKKHQTEIFGTALAVSNSYLLYTLMQQDFSKERQMANAAATAISTNATAFASKFAEVSNAAIQSLANTAATQLSEAKEGVSMLASQVSTMAHGAGSAVYATSSAVAQSLEDTAATQFLKLKEGASVVAAKVPTMGDFGKYVVEPVVNYNYVQSALETVSEHLVSTNAKYVAPAIETIATGLNKVVENIPSMPTMGDFGKQVERVINHNYGQTVQSALETVSEHLVSTNAKFVAPAIETIATGVKKVIENIPSMPTMGGFSKQVIEPAVKVVQEKVDVVRNTITATQSAGFM